VSEQAYRYLTERADRGAKVFRVGLAELHGDAATEGLVAELTRAVEGMTAPRVVLDFAAVGFITSMGIAALIRFWQLVRARGGRMALCGLSRNVNEVLGSSRLAHTDPAVERPFLAAPDAAAAVGLIAAE
jgi:anti-anti-sigma factor